MNNFDDFIPKSPLSVFSFAFDSTNVREKNTLSPITNKGNGADKPLQHNTNGKDNTITDQKSIKLPKNSSANLLSTNDKENKVVAVGLNINNEDSNVRSSGKKASALRANLFTAPAKVIDEIQKLLRTQKEEINSLKKENLELRRAFEVVQSNNSNLTKIVTTISSRVMELENQRHSSTVTSEHTLTVTRKNDSSSLVNGKGDSSLRASPSSRLLSNHPNDSRTAPEKEVCSPKETNHCETSRHNQSLLLVSNSNSKPNVKKWNKLRNEHSVGQRLLEEGICARNNARTSTLEKDNFNDEMKKLLLTIENRIRQEPQMFNRAKQLFYDAAAVPYRKSNFIPEISVPIVSERISEVDQATSINNPYNAKYTQRMTLKRSEVITYTSPSRNSIRSKQIGAICGNSTHMQISESQQVRKSETRRARPASTANDDEFFEQVNGDFNSNSIDKDPSFNDNDNHYYSNHQELGSSKPFIEELSNHYHYEPYEPEENQISRRERRERYRKR